MTPTENSFRTVLSLYRKNMSKAQRKRTRNLKPRTMVHPIGIEKEYARYIKEKTSSTIQAINKIVFPYLRRELRMDVAEDYSDMIESAYSLIDTSYGERFVSAISIGYALQNILEKVMGKDSAFLQKEIILRAGSPIRIDYPWWEDVKTTWTQQNFSLMKNLPTEYVTKLNNTILTGLQNGTPLDEIISQIDSIATRITNTRPNLIARDQIAKLNSIIAKNQYQSIGINNYYWMVMDDERLRGSPRGIYPKAVPSHFDMAGLLVKWDDPSVYSSDGGKTWNKKTAKMEPLQVGQAILCRCAPAPSWTEYLQEIDGEYE